VRRVSGGVTVGVIANPGQPPDGRRRAQAGAAPARAETHVLDGVGHSPHMEAAGEVNRLLEGFLAGVRAT
jgi:pimeloyl-ACP methyl ester carboxylesterase